MADTLLRNTSANDGGFYLQEDSNIRVTGNYAGATIPLVTQAMYDRTLLKRALPLLVHQKFGQVRPLRRRNGVSMVFRRYASLALATTPLDEGAPPTGVELIKEEVVARLEQYGNFTTITDLLDIAGFDDIINEAAMVLGENMGESMDVIYRDILNTGTQTIQVTLDGASPTFDVSGALTDVAGAITKQALDKAINILDRENAKKFTPLVGGQDKHNTWPLDAAYWAIIHPDTHKDLYDSTTTSLATGADFTPIEQYSAQMGVMEGEIGKYRNIRFVSTTHAKIWADSGGAKTAIYRATTDATVAIDVYSCLIMGRDAYGIVPLEGLSTRTIIHRAGSNTDPLNQKNTVAWKAASTAVILQDKHMVRIEHGAKV